MIKYGLWMCMGDLTRLIMYIYIIVYILYIIYTRTRNGIYKPTLYSSINPQRLMPHRWTAIFIQSCFWNGARLRFESDSWGEPASVEKTTIHSPPLTIHLRDSMGFYVNFMVMIWDLGDIPYGKLTVCYGKWPFIVSCPIKNGDFP